MTPGAHCLLLGVAGLLAALPARADGAKPRAAGATPVSIRVQQTHRAAPGGPRVELAITAPQRLQPAGAAITVPAGTRLVVEGYSLEGALCDRCALSSVLLSGEEASSTSVVDFPFHAEAQAAGAPRRVSGAGPLEASFEAGASVQIDSTARTAAGGTVSVTLTLVGRLEPLALAGR